MGLLLDTSLPIGSTTNFVNTFSFQGFAIDVRYTALPVMIGAQVSWQTITEKSERTLDFEVEGTGQATFSGTMVTELSLTPLLAKVGYVFGKEKLNTPPDKKKTPVTLLPYVALGMGGSRLVRRVDVGISRLLDESWHWTLVPEIGVEAPVGPVSILAAVRFNYLFSGDGAPEQLYMNFSLGVGLR